MIEIEFDECEYADSDYTDEELRSFYKLCGPLAKDKLLIPKVVDTC